MDDGSDDGSLRLAHEMCARDSRFRHIRRPRCGLVPTLNAGLACARGAYVARMDADDVMHRDRLLEQVRMLEAHSALIAVGCHVRLFPRAHLTAGRRAYEAWINSLIDPDGVACGAFIECPIVHPTLVIRRAALQAHGYRECAWPEDYDLVLRLLEAGERLGIVPRRLVLWRDRASRLSRTDPRYGLGRFAACKAHFLAKTFLKRSVAYVLWGYGDTGRTLVAALTREGRHVSHIVDVHPRRIGQRIAGVPVVGLDALDALVGQRLIVSVAGRSPREEIRRYLSDRGWVERRDFVVAA